jgi:hypothetical protein
MPNEPSKFNGDVIDLAVQIKELDLHRDPILTADTIGDLGCVTDLKRRVGLEVSVGPEPRPVVDVVTF